MDPAPSATPDRSDHDLVELIYASAAVRSMTRTELLALLAVARANNDALGVTGMLVYENGSFLQILEGRADVLEALLEKIGSDPRHDKLVLISRSRLPERQFGEWTMGFANVTRAELAEATGLNDFLDDHVTFGSLPPGRARDVLLKFKDGSWRRAGAVRR